MRGNITLRVIELENGCFAEFVQDGENEIIVYAHDKPYHATLFDSLAGAEQVLYNAKNKDIEWSYYGDLNFKQIRKIDFTME